MLPLALLKAAQGHPVLVELKSGETYNGHMANCDTWMNIHMREVICTSKDGDRFWRLPEAYLRGNTIKYLRLPEESLQKAREQSLRRDDRRQFSGGRGGGRGGPGGGRGPAGGRRGQYSGGRGDGAGGRGRGPPPPSAGRGSQ